MSSLTLVLIDLFVAHTNSLTLTSTPGVILSTGDALELICQTETGSNQAVNFDVVWRLNGTVMISSNYPEMTASYSDYTHYLRVDPIFSRDYSGTYSCELDGDAAVKASLSITVNPGMNNYTLFCTPRV